jgi:UDP:flavonoid glycosyltransferase YjiC (YdhE family)
MARIIIVAYGSLGDIHPAIALARGLEARGHHAAIATSEPYRAKLTAMGLPFHAVRPDLSLSDEALVRRVMDGAEGSQFLMRDLVFPAIREMHADLIRIAADADLLVTGDLACAMPIVAAQCGVPWAFFALSPISFFPVHDPSAIPGPPLLHAVQSFGPSANRFLHFLARIVSYSWWRPIRELRHELGLPAGESPLFNGKYSPRLNLALFSPILQPPQRDWPPRTRQTGFLFHDEEESASRLPADVQRFLDSGSPPLVFTLGSAAVHLAGDFYEQAAAAAQLLGRRAIFLQGRNPRPPGLPGSILSWDYLPYARILPHAAAIVHQGGVGTTAQALRAGRPMLVMPFAHDQFDNARRVTRLGVGRGIARKKFTAQSAARELDALLAQPRTLETAAAIGAQIRAERGVETACDALERMLG